jgi:hypothetical protein
MKVQKTFVGVRLLPSQLAGLEKLAEKKEDVTVSSLIREFIAAGLAKHSK